MQVKSLELERQHQEATLEKYGETLQNQKREIKELRDEHTRLKSVEDDFNK